MGALFGFATGTLADVRDGCRYAKEHEVNPWTGKERGTHEQMSYNETAESFN